MGPLIDAPRRTAERQSCRRRPVVAAEPPVGPGHPAKLSVRLRLSRDEVGSVGSSSEKSEDGEDTTMLVGRLRQSELLEDLRYMGLDRSIGDEQSLGQSAI